MDFIKNYIKNSIDTKRNILENEKILSKIRDVSLVIVDSLKKGGKVLICGNGGSAADSQHIAAEFVSRFYFDRPGLPAIALTVDTSILTAIGNDYGYEKTFSRQVQACANKGDVLIGISTSGSSKNVVNAILEAKNKGVYTVGLTGEKKALIFDNADVTINIPSAETPIIQESHIMVGHIICALVEKMMFSGEN